MTELPRVSIVIPMVDEAEHIESCLRRVLDQDLPPDRLEVIVVDGGSVDDSVRRAKRLLGDARLASWKVLHNSQRSTPSSLNRGLAEATGEILCRVDARTLVQPDHARRCAERLAGDPRVAVAGGSQVAVPRGPDARAEGIARALNNHLAMGGAAYRSGGTSGPTDTVYLGAFRTAELRAAGGWDERYPTNQDFELNRRMGRRGVVWFDAEIASGYTPRADLGDLWRQYHRFGRAKVRYWRTSGDRPLRRQRVILALPVVPLVMAVLVVGRKPAALVPMGAVAILGLAAVDAVGAGGRPRATVR
ncbi:MAG: glycosyltransferase, partial [Chloroflexota bacterium]|nr:glycosyltransferase [Chloroflexota bacterium]